MFFMCGTLFYTEKFRNNSGFYVTNGVVSLAAKGVHSIALIKKHQYSLKSVPWDIINWYFGSKEVGCVDMLYAAVEYGRPLRIFFFEDPNYVMNIMVS